MEVFDVVVVVVVHVKVVVVGIVTRVVFLVPFKLW